MPSWKNERLFFFVFLSQAIIDILPSRMYPKKKNSDGDYNVKRLTRRLTRDARNIIRNVGRIGDFETREIFRGLVKVSVKENEVPTEKNSSRASIFATKASYISN